MSEGWLGKYEMVSVIATIAEITRVEKECT